MEVKIGVLHAPRELMVDPDESADAILRHVRSLQDQGPRR